MNELERDKLTLEYIREYDDAAAWCAMRGLLGKEGDRLPDLLSDVVHAEINNHLEAFQERIRETLYSMSMEYALSRRVIGEDYPPDIRRMKP